MIIDTALAIKLAGDKADKVEYWVSPDGDGFWAIEYNGLHLYHEAIMTRSEAEEAYNLIKTVAD